MKKAGCLLSMLFGCTLSAMIGLPDQEGYGNPTIAKVSVTNEADEATLKVQELLKEWQGFEIENRNTALTIVSNSRHNLIKKVNDSGYTVVIAECNSGSVVATLKGMKNHAEAFDACQKLLLSSHVTDLRINTVYPATVNIANGNESKISNYRTWIEKSISDERAIDLLRKLQFD